MGDEKKALAVPQKFEIMQAGGSVGEIIKENVGELGMNANELDMVKIPSGEIHAFLMPSLTDEPEMAAAFHGVIVLFQEARRYWSTLLDDDERRPPDCTSDDGISGNGSPGGLCKKCPKAQWGSDLKGGDGQACQARRTLYIAMPDQVLPAVMSVPPTSLKPVRKFFTALASRRMKYYEMVMKFSLTIEKNKKGVEYSALRLSKARSLTPEELKALVEYRNEVIPVLKQRGFSDEEFMRGTHHEPSPSANPAPRKQEPPKEDEQVVVDTVEEADELEAMAAEVDKE